MRLGAKIKEARIREGFTQKELSGKTGLSERTIQRIENHDVEPSVYSLKKIGEVLHENFNEQKQATMKRKNQILNAVLAAVSVMILIEFIIGELDFKKDWWVLLCWFIPVLTGGITLGYAKRVKKG